jgi:hypothetical protein
MELLTARAPNAPRDETVDSLHAIFDRVIDAQSKGMEPPALQPSIDLARRYQARDDVVKLAEALEQVAHGAIASLARLRTACPDLMGGPR